MLAASEKFSEVVALLAHEPADSQGAGAVSTGWLFGGNYHRFVAILGVGEIQAGGTLDFKLEQASDSVGTGAKDITGKAITQLTQASGDGDDALIIELKGDEFDVANGFEYFRATATVATAASEFAIFVLGTVPRFMPVSTTNWAEIVS